MAKIPEGINGPVVGKVGTVIGASWRGIPYIRSLPKKRTSAPMADEMANRNKWALSQRWLQPVTAFVRAGFKGYSAKSEGFVAAKSYLLKNAMQTNENGPFVEPSLAKLSFGDLALPASIEVTHLESNLIQFSWDPSIANDNGHKGDQVMMLAYDLKRKAAYENLFGNTRKTGADVLKVKENRSATYHLYIAFVAHDRSRQSDSVYLGTIEVS